ncbi:hypothetical protein ACNPPY_01800 [Achromobacter sp. AGC78]|uniref:hypothetical protein n=1 Tax=Achromobacter sp. JUb104 TaxID=2940590 RepID=UPI002166ED85|nr:hypothetical protein [Achromobacter sp. JUb104]
MRVAMSWRLLFATLLIALGASAWGGIQLGDWLVAHAPPAAPAPGQDAAASQQPVLDANGRPYVAQPPQPRIDGTLGVPDKPADREWQVNTVSLFDTVSDPSVKLSRERITPEQAREIAAASEVPLPSGSSDVTTMDLQVPGTSTAINGGQMQAGGYGTSQMVQAPPPPPNTSPAPGVPGWQDALKRELAQCATQGFFERPSCSWNARNKYCAPNRAWGTMAECPARPQ